MLVIGGTYDIDVINVSEKIKIIKNVKTISITY